MSYLDWLHAWGYLGEPKECKCNAGKEQAQADLQTSRGQTFEKTSLRTALRAFVVKHAEDIIWIVAALSIFFMCGVFLIVIGLLF